MTLYHVSIEVYGTRNPERAGQVSKELEEYFSLIRIDEEEDV